LSVSGLLRPLSSSVFPSTTLFRSQPFVVAYMTEQLQLQKDHRVLEIGTGSGYQAAVLSRLCKQVLTIERYRTLADSARERLEKRSEEHTSELQSRENLVCRLLLEK